MSQESILSPDSIPRISYALNHEDILLDRIFDDHPGTYLDVGAGAPTTGNVTYFFYRRGWRGVNLEPDPRLHQALKAERFGDLNLGVAAWDSNGEIPFFDVAGGEAYHRSTLSARVAAGYRAAGHPVVEHRVPVRTIGSLVEELEIDPPDFLALDAEGSEDAVIRGIPLDRWRPGALAIGATWPEPGDLSPRSWEPLLIAHGYCFAAFNGVSRVYLRDDLRERLPRLALPVSSRDRFQTAEVAALHARVHELTELSRKHAGDQPRSSERFSELERLHSEAVRQCAQLEGRLAWAEKARLFWQRESAALLEDLVATQRALRPYRLIDQLGVVPIGYRWARRLKAKRAS